MPEGPISALSRLRPVSGKSFLAVMAVLGVVALLAFGVISKSGKALEVGEAAPVAELPLLTPGDTTDATASISEFGGRWLLLNIWASWCGPCETEAPDLVEFQEEHGGRTFTVLGIQTQDGTEDGRAFIEEYGLNYASLRDGSGDYADELGSTGVPETILVDPNGNVAYIRRGEVDAELLEAEVEPLITAATVPPEES
jgi:cytochrome c biogenesis protein CcmG, thiol:disulfide interchange protein DsbE